MEEAEAGVLLADHPAAPQTAKPKLNGYASLIQAKKLADALGGVEVARAVLDVLAKLL